MYPNQFPSVHRNADIVIEEVTASNYNLFVELQYQEDLQYGNDFAEQKKILYNRQLVDHTVVQLLALYKGTPAGAVTVFISENTAEIDGLFVVEKLQKKGIGSNMQKFIMDKFPNKLIILLADGEDTPKEMYKKQNYQYCGCQYEAIKVYEK
ncbi:MAG: GNAT family N-acetyltransferase [Bacillus sp. (in: firmicutes)]